MKIGRNDPCHCGSGKKFKKCHGSSAEAQVVAEISKIGPQWVHRHVNKLLHLAGYQAESDMDLTTQMIHILDQASVGNYADCMLESKSKKEREIFQSLHLALGQSIVEPLEILEVKRGYSIKVKGYFTHKVVVIEQSEDAELLEPMEWILGRVVTFAKKSYLLADWKKVPFRQRKNLRRLIQAQIALEAGEIDLEKNEHEEEATTQSTSLKNQVAIDSIWFKQNAIQVLQQYQEVVAS